MALHKKDIFWDIGSPRLFSPPDADPFFFFLPLSILAALLDTSGDVSRHDWHLDSEPHSQAGKPCRDPVIPGGDSVHGSDVDDVLE